MPRKDEIVGVASIAVPPNDPSEQYLLDHKNDMFMNERWEIDEILFNQGPVLKQNLPESLGILLHQRVISCLSLNHYLILLNMLILMKRRYILLLLVLTFQSMKKRNY